VGVPELLQIPLAEPVISLGVTPDGARVLAGHASGKLRVIDTTTRIATTIRIQGGPVNDLCITPDGRWAYVAALEYGLKKVDLASGSVSPVWSGTAVGLALTPNGRMLFASLVPRAAGGSPGKDAIGWFDGASGHLANAITGLPLVATWLTLTPDGSQLWAGTEDACSHSRFDHCGCPVSPGGAIHVISTASQKLIRTLGFALPAPAWAVPFPDGSLMALRGSQAPVLVDTKTLETVRSLPVMLSGKPAFTWDGSAAYVPQRSESRVDVVEFSPVGKAPSSPQAAPGPLLP